MNKDAEIEDFPLGCVVKTPTGCIGVVVKHRYASKIDHFARVDVQFSNNPRDGVVLQPKYLVLVELPPLDYRPPVEYQTATARARVVRAIQDIKRKSNDCAATVAAEGIKPQLSLSLEGFSCACEVVQATVLGADIAGEAENRLAGSDSCLDDVLPAGQAI